MDLKISTSAQPENSTNIDSDRIDLTHKRLLRVLGPVGKRWNYVEDVLFWKKPKHSACWLLFLNVLFAYLASPKLRVYVVVVILMMVSICFDVVRHKVWEGLERAGIMSLPQEDESDKIKLTNFDDFCKALAKVFDRFGQHWISLCELRKSSRRKFGAALFCILSVLALFFHYAPVVTLSYILVMFGFIWPALGYYGLRKKISSKMQPVFHPLWTQWRYNRTKRQRNKTMRSLSVNQSISEESEDDEFKLDKETEAALTKALSDSLDPQTTRRAIDQSTLSSKTMATSWSGSSWGRDTDSPLSFTEGMTMPSLMDSLDLSIDQDFAQGLEFPDITQSGSSSMDSLHMIDDDTLTHDDYASHTSVSTPNTTDYPGFSDQTDDDHGGHYDENKSLMEVQDQPIWFSEKETVLRHRQAVTPAQINRDNLLGRPLVSHSQQSSTSSDFTDYEMLDHSELDGVTTDDTPPSPGLAVTQIVSSGLSYVGKWVGYK